ncbi:hypothetical protein KC316_g3010 [Hortaea werneckii]|uniref:Zn(2)-C6 fungal-type domain-containing protein n=1 Tax=Hortaea werneckii TaxID=91943 RepID=A0A3M7AS11_HORWE|nr:hypothetical protein KC334_g3658 [Hortaea werneckii]KAI7200060.1 hypothetical protein KC324_g2919 [Hortaea werneckii]KAI7591169.1 hypothetical protein KC316_g3010 [Hortaea werneckii]RMY30199.1 hypothetical protein D0866_08159 [Hortaea werneckii]
MDVSTKAPGSARKNVTTACRTCRDSKTKCDAVKPDCTPCVRRGKECKYEAREDKRRVPLRPALQALRRRIDDLTEALEKANLDLPSLNSEDQYVANRGLEAVGLPVLRSGATAPPDLGAQQSPGSLLEATGSTPEVSVSQHSQQHNALQFPTPVTSWGQVHPEIIDHMDDQIALDDWPTVTWDETVSPDWPWAPLSDQELGVSLPRPKPSDHGAPNRFMPAAAQTATGSDEEDEENQDIINQIAARFGSLQLAPDGKLRYLGTPANFHLFGNGRSPAATTNARSLRLEGRRLLQSLELDQAIDPSLENHLIKIYFAWHNASHAVIDESTFWLARQQQTEIAEVAGIYSEVLVNAICAIGASYESRYHPHLATFPRTLADFFAERTKTLLELELDSPSVSTIQALLLLSSHETGNQRIARSWLYGGMAMRLCFDIGLHIDTTPYVDHGVMSATESQARSTAFWASYVMNYRMSFSLGRPFTLDGSEITVKKPTPDSFSYTELWQPYPSTIARSPHSSGGLALLDVISAQRINLCETVEPIARALYGNTRITLKTLQEHSERSVHAMLTWKNNLPPSLHVRADYAEDVVPQVLVLHLEYHYLQILVHRPWTSRRHQPVPAQGPGYRHARKMCIDSACAIAQILSVFEEQFGLMRLDVETAQILPSAALILTFATVSQTQVEQWQTSSTANENEGSDWTLVSHLNTLFRASDELGRRHSSAKDHLESLLVIQQKWKDMHKQQSSQSKKRRDANAPPTTDVFRSAKRSKGTE